MPAMGGFHMSGWLRPLKAALEDSVFKARQRINRKYMESLDCRRLMANYYKEAGLTSNLNQENVSIHYGGWEEPDQQVGGSFTGHYLSAAAMLSAAEDDSAFKLRVDTLVDELERCGKEHLDGWCMSIPQLYLDWIMQDKWVWAPQYMVHKTLMGLADAYKYTGNKKALQVADRACGLLYNRVKDYTREQQNQMLKWETGGLMEVFADLFGITGDEKYHLLLERYCRYELFDRLLAGEDALTYAHANTTIPEAQGCARAYEVTGDVKFRRMAEAFWRNGVEERNAFATGSQNSHELWLPDVTGRDSAKDQEFCTVYNLIRLADYLFRWSGDVKYSDYIEQALYNGVLAQQHRTTGANAYFLPLCDGSHKDWGDLYNAMYCCYGTTVQAQSYYGYLVFYSRDGEITLSQYIPAKASVDGIKLSLTEHFGMQDIKNLDRKVYTLTLSQETSSRFALKLRVPKWSADFRISDDGQAVDAAAQEGFAVIDRQWGTQHTICISFAWPLSAVPLSSMDDRYAILWGPAVLAGLVNREYAIKGNPEAAGGLLRSVGTMDHYGDVRQWVTKGQDANFRFMPLYDVTDETYTIYFPFAKG